MTPMVTTFALDEIGRGLPIDPEDLSSQLAAHRHLVIEAPPGTGKTTLVPPALANIVGGQGKVIVTSPRRVTARAAARRLRYLSGDSKAVGYRVKGDSQAGSAVEFVTPRVLVNALLRDPELPNVAAVVIDEVHERHLDTDLLLGMLIELTQLREDLRVVAMSATADAPRFATLMGAEIASYEAPMFPLTTTYAPHPERIQLSDAFLRHVAHVTQEASEKATGRALVFVPRIRDVERLTALIPGSLPLHGSLTAKEQDRALNRREGTVVATPIAESSLTVPGVTTVIDTGLERQPKRDALRGVTGLVTQTISQSSATQRAGRAAREAPGTVVCCYRQGDLTRDFPTPEILSADLTEAVLTALAWGSTELPMLDPFPEPAFTDALTTLEALHLANGHAITDLGRKAAAIPTDPRSAATLLRLGSGAAPAIARLTDDDPKRLARFTHRSRTVDPGTVASTLRPEWVAKKQADGTYLTAAGFRAGTRSRDMPHTDWIAITDISRSPRGYVINHAEPVNEEPEFVTDRKIITDGDNLQVRLVTHLGAIVIKETPAQPTPEERAQFEASKPKKMSARARNLFNRLQIAHRHHSDEWPEPQPGDYKELMGQVPWDKFGDIPPETWTSPAGNNHRINYTDNGPEVALKLQECFGLTTTPTIVGVPIIFELLSPAGRPLARTQDLASFWSGPYQGVRADMRGRYPKHPWPEDPLTAKPTARTKKRL